jgi:hypothetical protein
LETQIRSLNVGSQPIYNPLAPTSLFLPYNNQTVNVQVKLNQLPVHRNMVKP